MQRRTLSPYSLFFPLGVVFTLAGTILWPLFTLQRLSTYPGTLHAEWMMGGFILSFVTGFLLTAIPKYIGSRDSAGWETALALVLLLAQFIPWSKTTHGADPHQALSFLLLLHLTWFSVRRYSRRQYDPPASFAFVALGLLVGAAGALLLTFPDLGLPALGRIFFYRGMVLSLVIGVGGKFFPSLFGFYNPSLVQLSSFQPNVQSRLNRYKQPALCTLLLISFLIQGTLSPQLGSWIQTLTVSWIAITEWKLHRHPVANGALPLWLWISAITLCAGLWAEALLPGYSIHAMHLAYAGGFGIIVLTIAARVILAHGGYGLEFEHRSKALGWSGSLVLLAAATRATAILLPQTYLNHLSYASMTWIAGWLIWSWVFVPKMLPKRPAHST